MILAGILKADVSLSKAYENAPVLIIAAPVLLVTFIAFKAFELYRRKIVNESVELAEHITNTEELFSLAKNELGIPENNVEIDVLFTRYVIKNGKDMYERLVIPLSSLGKASLSNKLRERASFSNWNKSEAYNSDTYKKYKITLNDQGSYFCGFYTVEIRDTKGDFCLLIPSYDFENFSALTGVRSVEN